MDVGFFVVMDNFVLDTQHCIAVTTWDKVICVHVKVHVWFMLIGWGSLLFSQSEIST